MYGGTSGLENKLSRTLGFFDGFLYILGSYYT